jgi:predicted transcriptional regulator
MKKRKRAETVSSRITPDVKERLEHLAEVQEKTVSTILNDAIKYYIQGQEVKNQQIAVLQPGH